LSLSRRRRRTRDGAPYSAADVIAVRPRGPAHLLFLCGARNTCCQRAAAAVCGVVKTQPSQVVLLHGGPRITFRAATALSLVSASRRQSVFYPGGRRTRRGRCGVPRTCESMYQSCGTHTCGRRSHRAVPVVCGTSEVSRTRHIGGHYRWAFSVRGRHGRGRVSRSCSSAYRSFLKRACGCRSRRSVPVVGGTSDIGRSRHVWAHYWWAFPVGGLHGRGRVSGLAADAVGDGHGGETEWWKTWWQRRSEGGRAAACGHPPRRRRRKPPSPRRPSVLAASQSGVSLGPRWPRARTPPPASTVARVRGVRGGLPGSRAADAGRQGAGATSAAGAGAPHGRPHARCHTSAIDICGRCSGHGLCDRRDSDFSSATGGEGGTGAQAGENTARSFSTASNWVKPPRGGRRAAEHAASGAARNQHERVGGAIGRGAASATQPSDTRRQAGAGGAQRRAARQHRRPTWGAACTTKKHRPPICFLHLNPIVSARCASVEQRALLLQSSMCIEAPILSNATMRS